MESKKLARTRLALDRVAAAAVDPKAHWVVYGAAVVTTLLFTTGPNRPKVPVGLGD